MTDIGSGTGTECGYFKEFQRTTGTDVTIRFVVKTSG